MDNLPYDLLLSLLFLHSLDLQNQRIQMLQLYALASCVYTLTFVLPNLFPFLILHSAIFPYFSKSSSNSLKSKSGGKRPTNKDIALLRRGVKGKGEKKKKKKDTCS